MLLLPQALQKDSEFKGFRSSITAILLSAACTDPGHQSSTSNVFAHSLAESPRILEFTRLSSGFGESCKSHVDSMGNAA